METTLTDVLIRLARADGGQEAHLARPVAATVTFNGGGLLAQAGVYLGLGVRHILMGLDHLLFVLGLVMIVRGRMRLVKTATAFTAAHSLTLAAATLGVAQAPAPPLNVAIALSILFLAPEMLRAVRALGLLVMGCALAGMLAALLLRLAERRREFATWRLLGATRGQVLALAALEAVLLALAGSGLGILLAHVTAAVVARWAGASSALGALSAALHPSEAWVLGASAATAVLAAAVAAAVAARTDAARELVGEAP